jgi:hypothetical protein
MTEVNVHTSEDDLADLGEIDDYADVSVVRDDAAIGWEFKDATTANKFRRDLLELLEKYGLD